MEEDKEMYIQTAPHILLATDGSEHALAAARFLRSHVAPRSIHRITILAVVRPLNTAPFLAAAAMGGAAISPKAWDELNASAEAAARKAVEEAANEIGDLAMRTETLIRTGSPADEIVHAAEELGATVIVVGSRGWGRVRSVLLGSVSERVLHAAHCPVLVVRPPLTGDDRLTRVRGAIRPAVGGV
jgi:nucleotide-binding universal stress UspA family protein